MTPEERNLVVELFDRLAALEDAQRDPDAERLIRDGLRQAPNAPYALVQTVLVQDEALKRADARIRELEGAGEPPRDSSFLGNARDSLQGRRGSVPSVRPGEAAQDASQPQGMSPAWNTGALAGVAQQARQGDPSQQGYGGPQQGYPGGPQQGYPGGPQQGYPGGPPMGQGGSFLGTAAAAAAGMIGGSLLLGGIRSMMGHQGGSAHAAYDPGAGGGGSPWAGGSAAGGELSREAGLNDIGRGGGSSGGGGGDRGFGLLDDSSGDHAGYDGDDDQDDFDGGDFDGGGDGGEE